MGERLGPFPGRLDADLVRRYAAATRDPSPLVAAGLVVPAVAVVTQVWHAMEAGLAALLPDPVRASATGAVHGEHDIVLHRPLVPGEPLRTWVQGHGARPAGRNLAVTLHHRTVDGSDRLVAEQWWTTIFLGAIGEPVGAGAPDHHFPERAGDTPLGAVAVGTDNAMVHGYAEVSGDRSEHHFTAEAARRSGFDRPFLHGLCTMALCAHGVLTVVGEGGADRVRRVAVRFAAPVFIGDDVAIEVRRAGDGAFAFEAAAGGGAVIRNGLLELRP